MSSIMSYISDDTETNAVWVVRFASVQFALSFFTSITRPDANAALALLGLYAAFGRRKEATKLYFIFLLLSIVTDFIWLVMYGNQISGAELAQYQTGEDYAFPPIGTAKFVLGMAIIQFIIKMGSCPVVFKLFTFLPEDDFSLPSGGYTGGIGGGSSEGISSGGSGNSGRGFERGYQGSDNL